MVSRHMYLRMVMALPVMYMMVNGIRTTGQTRLCIQPEQTNFLCVSDWLLWMQQSCNYSSLLQ